MKPIVKNGRLPIEVCLGIAFRGQRKRVPGNRLSGGLADLTEQQYVFLVNKVGQFMEKTLGLDKSDHPIFNKRTLFEAAKTIAAAR